MTHEAQKTDLREKVAAIIFDREYPDAWQEARKRCPDVEDYLKDADAVLSIARPAIIEECALKCEWIADQVQERKENQAIELGALRCRDIVRKLLAEKP